MEANDSCGMASLDTSSMDVGMTVFSHYNSMGGVYARDRIQLTQNHIGPFRFITSNLTMRYI